MPDLKNKLPHRWGGSVNVRGTTYEIDRKGICRGVSDDHAQAMLQNSAWSVWVDEDTKPSPQEPAPAPQPEPAPEPVLEQVVDAEPEPEPPKPGLLRKKRKKKKIVKKAPSAD